MQVGQLFCAFPLPRLGACKIDFPHSAFPPLALSVAVVSLQRICEILRAPRGRLPGSFALVNAVGSCCKILQISSDFSSKQQKSANTSWQPAMHNDRNTYLLDSHADKVPHFPTYWCRFITWDLSNFLWSVLPVLKNLRSSAAIL